MHKAENKYEVGKVRDEEEAKQRRFRAILNKLTPHNFAKLLQAMAIDIDNAETLRGVVGQIFDRALMEPTFCEMYVCLCFHLSGELPDFSEDKEKITFKRVLVNKCQEEFERGEREQEEANKADEEGEVKQSEEEKEEKRIKARRRMLGNIRLIGEMYKKRMLTERIMHGCIKKLLGQPQTPDEEDVEALCKLMSTIGEIIDHPKAKEHMDAYFEGMKSLSNNMNLSSRVRFMLKDAIDLRKNKWQQRRKVEGPNNIRQMDRDVAQYRQAQASRLGDGLGVNLLERRWSRMDYGPRGSAMLSSPGSQLGGSHTLPAQVHGFGNSRHVQVDERQPFEARTLSVPLAQGPDDAITLGPQDGRARSMSIRGLPSMSSASLADVSPSSGDYRKVAAGLSGYGSMLYPAYSPREDLIPRFIPDRFSGQAAYDHSSAQERTINHGSEGLRDSGTFDRSVPTSPPACRHALTSSQNSPTDSTWLEEHLQKKSRAAIKEFYSARDEEEVTQCIKELNHPSFHPTMISIWVTDSFEGKDVDRDLLAKLLVNLIKFHGDTLSQSQVIKGYEKFVNSGCINRDLIAFSQNIRLLLLTFLLGRFESVLTTLEDTIIDAPKAPQYLGQIFAKLITENVASLGEIGQLIYHGGEEPDCLLNASLAADVLGNVLEFIRLEKGENVFW
ncbi:26S proteasome regulatory complex, non-ATPase subcomplex, Rpn1 subunit [Trema orientale]|uniref:26S proteasome regulatory complex, non-ATPase subcomplex, Rpn1 subunit n=1 Tax=Trema orientale TaxID=63057 RepID=A0A2P5FPR1_TREOI|nr:26S proteasome regulatory complex, non-ATPase subcomplex, Rpn1 subunit [Trema orientale]